MYLLQIFIVDFNLFYTYKNSIIIESIFAREVRFFLLVVSMFTSRIIVL
jgi:hypothetical protein